MKIKIAYICLQATREGQASHAHVHEIINGLRKCGCQITLFEPSYAKEFSIPRWYRKLYSFYTLQLNLCPLIDRFDLMYVRMHPCAFFSIILSKIYKLPLIIEVNGVMEELYFTFPYLRIFFPLYKYLYILFLKKADAIIVVTPQLKNYYLRFIKNVEYYVIPNAANHVIFNPLAKSAFNFSFDYVLFFGALAKWQGIEIMLGAVLLSDWPEDIKLVIAGDGVEKSKILQHSKINDKIYYLGEIGYQEIPGLITNSIACLCVKNNITDQYSSGFSPLKVFETMSCGCPIIVSDYPYMADLVRYFNCGIVIPNNDPISLAKAVNFLTRNRNDAKKMGDNGYHAILESHNWMSRAVDTYNVIKNIITRK